MLSPRKSISGPVRVKMLTPDASDAATATVEKAPTVTVENTKSPTVQQNAKKRRSLLGGASRVKTPPRHTLPISQTAEDKENKNSNNKCGFTEIESSPEAATVSPLCHVSCNDESDLTVLIANANTNATGTTIPLDGSGVNRSANTSNIPKAGGKPQPSWTVNDFILGKPIGKGKFGNVYAGKQKNTNAPIAMKVLYKAPLQAANSVHVVRREVEIQTRLRHPNIVCLHGYFHDVKNMYLVMEYLDGGELFKLLARQPNRVVQEAQAKRYLMDIASAVRHMHSCHVIHRDIKPENILIGSSGNLKLADFGWAVHHPVPDTATSESCRRYTLCGTPEYIAPEMIHSNYAHSNTGDNSAVPSPLILPGHSFEVDNWALGILLFELLIGYTPFRGSVSALAVDSSWRLDSDVTASSNTPYVAANDDRIEESLYQRILLQHASSCNMANLSPPAIVFPQNSDTGRKSVSQQVQHLVCQLLHPNPVHRWTAADVLLEKHWSN